MVKSGKVMKLPTKQKSPAQAGNAHLKIREVASAQGAGAVWHPGGVSAFKQVCIISVSTSIHVELAR